MNQRRQTPSSTSEGLSPRRGFSDNQDYYDDGSDEEKGKRPQDQMYHGACSLGRFCLNPCLCLATTARMICCRPRQGGTPQRARRRPSASIQKSQWKQLNRRIITCIRGSLLLLVICVVVFRPRHSRYPLRHQSDRSLDRMPLLIQLFDYTDANDLGGWHYPASKRFPSTSSLEPLPYATMADFGGLEFATLPPSKFRRRIAPDNDIAYEAYRKKLTFIMDQKFLRSAYDHFEEKQVQTCRTPNFEALYFPTCNDFHEFDLTRDYDEHISRDLSYYDSYFFGHGYYRDAWMLKHVDSKDTDKSNDSVLKTLRYVHDFSIKDYFGIQKDALVMERLTSSPRILNMFGHCSMSMLVQPMPYEVEAHVVPGNGMIKQAELDEFEDVKPMNNFNVSEKLGIALEMAESLADLHGYKSGVIVHDDVQLCQWLRGHDNKLVLGDFNRAEVMEWNTKDERFCKYKNGYVYGNVSA